MHLVQLFFVFAFAFAFVLCHKLKGARPKLLGGFFPLTFCPKKLGGMGGSPKSPYEYSLGT